MRCFFILLCLLKVSMLHAFLFVIKGTTIDRGAITIRRADVVNDLQVLVDSEGAFSVNFDLNHPTQFQIICGSDQVLNFFVFDSGTITLNIIDPAKNITKVEGLPEKSLVFARIEEEIFSIYGPQMAASHNKDSFLALLPQRIKDAYSLADDVYTQVFVKSARVALMSTLMDKEYQPLYKIDTTLYFKDLPWQAMQFSGLDYYNNVMWPAWISSLKDSIILRHTPGYVPTFTETVDLINKRCISVAAKTCANALYMTLMSTEVNKLDKVEKAAWENATLKFCNTNPGYPFTSYLQEKYSQVNSSLVNTMAPNFYLENDEGRFMSLEDFKGRYLLLDITSDWCVACKQQDKILQGLFAKYGTKNITFVSISNYPGKEQWLDHLKREKAFWPQLFCNPEFLQLYKIYAYPTLLLISPSGKIIKQANRIEEADISFIKD